MGRSVRRVALDFEAPLTAWAGYIQKPEGYHTCPSCGGRNMSPENIRLHALWYGQQGQLYGALGDAKGAHRWMPDDPEIRAQVEPKVDRSPEFYGSGEPAYAREARRMCGFWNEAWYARLTDKDAAAIEAAGDLPMEWTHEWRATGDPERPRCWVERPRQDWPEISGRSISAHNLAVMGGNVGWGLMVRRELERLGEPYECQAPGCDEGLIFDSPEAKAAYEGWERTEPPEGEGWQMWQTVSDGPITPVFDTPEALARHLSQSARYSDGLTQAQWLKFIKGPGWAPSASNYSGEIERNAVGVVARLERDAIGGSIFGRRGSVGEIKP